MGLFVNITKSDNSDNICWISKDLLDVLRLTRNKIYKIRLGQCIVTAQLQISDKNEQYSITLSAPLFAQLAIPENLSIGIMMRGREIILGPVLGIFVTPRYIKDLQCQTPRPSSWHMQKANEHQHMLIYYFSIYEKFNLDNQIESWFYSTSSHTWVKVWLPQPDVVYDRGAGFYKKEIPLVKQIRKRFSPEGPITRINASDCLDKYWLHERLKQYRHIKSFLPETVKYNSIDDLIQMINKHRTVFLKSFYGSLSSEVMSVTLLPKNIFKCSYAKSNKVKRKTIRTIDDLSDLITYFFAGKEFIVQQGIDLIEYHKSRIDMRILMQKNENGMWSSVYNAVNIGKKNLLITADKEKGEFYNFDDIMPLVLNLPHSDVEELDNRLRHMCSIIARAIEKEYGMFGEIGMDVALDKKLNMWFIEANSKPDRNLESGIKGKARFRAACLNIINYTKYLVCFNRSRN